MKLIQRVAITGAWVLASALAPAAGTEGRQDAAPLDVLRRALANRYDLDLAQRIELTLRNGFGDQRNYVVEMASKRIDGQLRSLARFLHPPDDYGIAILMIEQRDRHDDTFIYLPYAKRVRRVSSAQRADRLMGTDLTYEDFERRYAEDYTILSESRSQLHGEPVILMRVELRFDSAYPEVSLQIHKPILTARELEAAP